MAIVNFSTLSTSGFDDDILTTTTAGEKIFNFGRLTTTGDLANSIFADAADVSVRNFNRIETSGLGAAGIFVNGANAQIENYGTVTTHGGFFDPDPTIDGDEFFSEGILANGDGFRISNFGTVKAEGESASALVGVGADGVVVNVGRVESSSNFSAAVVALGDRSTAINAGTMTLTGDFITGLSAVGEDAVTINLGQILATGGEAVAGMGGALGNNSHVTNKGIIRVAADDSFGILARVGEALHVNNFGRIETEGTFAVGIGTGGLATEIVNAGHIATEGELALGVTLGVTRIGFVRGADGTIVNRGVVDTEGAGAAGVVMNGDGHHLINSGRITADGGAFDSDILGVTMRAAGVVVSGDGALVENTRSGVIRSKDADSTAVELNVLEQDGLPAAAMSSQLENFGLIDGKDVAVLGGAGQETVVNHGRIVGDVDLGGGDDMFVFGRGGTLSGDLLLGGGDDLVVIENGSGRSRVADFAAGAESDDVIDVSDFFSSFGALVARSHQQGSNVVITLDHNDRLTLENVQLNALNAGDFLFV